MKQKKAKSTSSINKIMKKSEHLSKERAGIIPRINEVPYLVKEQNKLADEMHVFYFDEKFNRIDINTFPLEYRYTPSKLFRIAETNPYFADILEHCRTKIAMTLLNLIREDPENKALYNKLLPLYHKETREYELEKRANFEKKMAQQSGRLTIDTVCGSCLVKG